jgi:hypothetical protein
MAACEGADPVGLAGLAEGTLAGATGAAFTTPRALELGDVFRPEFVVIILCLLYLFLVQFEPPMRLRL